MTKGVIDTGTASVTNGTKTVTFAGVSVSLFAQNDRFIQGGSVGVIDSVDAGAGTATLTQNWPGTTSSAAIYTVVPGVSDEELAVNTRTLMQYISGPLLTIAAMTGDDFPDDGYFLVADTGDWSTVASTGTGPVVRADSPTITGLLDLSDSTAGQIKFPATQNASSDANTLDDYEEGTWSPKFTTSGGSPVVTMDATTYGYYTKIGNVVHIQAVANLASFIGTPSGRMQISGLPFANGDGQVAVAIYSEAFDSSIDNIVSEIHANTSIINLFSFSGGAVADIGSSLKAGQIIGLFCSYRI